MSETEEYEIRPLTPADQSLLWEMLYLSLYVPEGDAPFAREVVGRPEIARYVREWGREGDGGFVAVDGEGRPVGAVWLRLLRGEERGFGHVDDATPELGVAVVAEHRGRGVGTRLLSRLIESAAGEFESVSLSVSAGNPARRLYERLGFEEVGTCGDSITMRRRLRAK
jgi:ribosomal protein S18 acetylase RimI-like enzyme